MKTHRQSRNGAVLVFALLILVVGATILGGIAQLAVTQSVAGQTEWEAAARRLRLENSRAMARQYVLSQMWQGFGQLPQASLGTNATGGLGGFAITNVDPPFGYWLSLQQTNTDRINPFNLFERGGFQSAWAAGSLSTGSGDVPWGFQIRTRSPITAGFAFVNQRPASNNWAPLRRMNMWQTNDYAVGFTNLPRMPVSSVTNTNTGDTNGFLGYLLLPKSEALLGDVLASPVTGSVTTNTNGLSSTNIRITVDLNIYDYGLDDTPRFYEVPYRVDRFNVSTGSIDYACFVTELVLTNSAGSATSFKTQAVQVLIPESNTSLTNVILAGDNTRQVYLYRKGTNAPTLTIANSGGSATFRIGMTLDCQANIQTSGVLTIRGGIRTSRALTQSSGTLTLVSDDSSAWEYDAIADRMMWLEDQRAR